MKLQDHTFDEIVSDVRAVLSRHVGAATLPQSVQDDLEYLASLDFYAAYGLWREHFPQDNLPGFLDPVRWKALREAYSAMGSDLAECVEPRGEIQIDEHLLTCVQWTAATAANGDPRVVLAASRSELPVLTTAPMTLAELDATVGLKNARRILGEIEDGEMSGRIEGWRLVFDTGTTPAAARAQFERAQAAAEKAREELALQVESFKVLDERSDAVWVRPSFAEATAIADRFDIALVIGIGRDGLPLMHFRRNGADWDERGEPIVRLCGTPNPTDVLRRIVRYSESKTQSEPGLLIYTDAAKLLGGSEVPAEERSRAIGVVSRWMRYWESLGVGPSPEPIADIVTAARSVLGHDQATPRRRSSGMSM